MRGLWDRSAYPGGIPISTPYPIVPGHEARGMVSAVGSAVVGLSEGDRVAIDPSLFCGACHFCRLGRGNLCERWGAIGDTVDGAFVRAPWRKS